MEIFLHKNKLNEKENTYCYSALLLKLKLLIRLDITFVLYNSKLYKLL